MSNEFFAQPILNSPYDYPARHWDLDTHGQPTQRIIEARRTAKFVSPIPKPRKRTAKAVQQSLGLADPDDDEPSPVLPEPAPPDPSQRRRAHVKFDCVHGPRGPFATALWHERVTYEVTGEADVEESEDPSEEWTDVDE